MKNKIESICAATGWCAKFEIEGKIYFTPLACWALTKSGKIEGVLFEGKKHFYASEDEYFLDYIPEKLIDEDEQLSKQK